MRAGIDGASPAGRRAIVVLGMHRSGTSAVARALSLCGAQLPGSLIPPKDENPLGFWESPAFIAINERIFRTFGAYWDDVFTLRMTEELARHDEQFLPEIVQAIEDEFHDASLIVLKDPRISVLVDLWDRALSRADFEPFYVIVVRNPLDVAASLKIRDLFPVAKTAMIWARYMIAAERDTRGKPRVFVSYDALVDDWRRQIYRLAPAGLEAASVSAEVQKDIDGFLSLDHRHHAASREDINAHPDVPPLLKTLFDWLSAACRDDVRPLVQLDQAYADFAAAEATFGAAVAFMRWETEEFRKRADEGDRVALENVALHAALRDSDKTLENANRAHAIAVANLANARVLAIQHHGQISSLQAQMQSLETDIGEARAEAAAQSIAAARDRDLSTARQIALEGERDRWRDEAKAIRANRDALLASTAWRLTAPFRAMLARRKG